MTGTRIEEEHKIIVASLERIKSACQDMREEGLGGDDFEGLYLKTRLVPEVQRIFAPKQGENDRDNTTGITATR